MQENRIRFVSQCPIKTPFNTATFLCDYVLLDKAVIVEVDGALHLRLAGAPAKRRIEKDRVKNHCLTAYGYRVLRFQDTDVLKNPSEVLAKIKEALK